MKEQLSEMALKHTVENFSVWLHGVYCGVGPYAEMGMSQIRAVHAVAQAALADFSPKDCEAGSLLHQQWEFTTHVEHTLYGFVTYDQPPRVDVINDLALRLNRLLAYPEEQQATNDAGAT